VNLVCSRTRSRASVAAGVSAWHSTHRPPPGWRVAFLLKCRGAAWGDLVGYSVVGVSTWGRPVARAEDQSGATLEHTRMALSPGAPKNSASWFIAQNRRWIRENMPEVGRLIAYVDESDHSGVTYRADNWRPIYSRRRKAQSWANRPGRTGRKAILRTKFEREP
jgi:hypothetical protein